MEEVLKKMRAKYTLTTTLIAGAFLLILFCGFFTLLFASNEIVIDRTLDVTISSSAPAPGADITSGRRCFKFQVIGDYATKPEEVNYYGNSAEIIIKTAVLTENGKFRVDDFYFKVKSVETGAGIYTYAVYDRTSDRYSLVSTAFILAMMYIASVMLIALIAYLLSGRMVQPAEESFKKQRDLIANASHELKTPLTIISTDLSVIQSEPSSAVADNEKWIASIQSQVTRMNGLIQNMLELSKLEQSVVPKELFDFSATVEGACLEFDAVCFEKGITLVTDVERGVTAFGDKNALERLVIILLDNAAKYCGEKGRIGCQLKCDKKIRLKIMNTGQSISKEEASRVFDRFYRADGARSNPDNQSFGLGLSIAQATVRAHGGDVSCHGVEGKGTIFEVVLPIPKRNSKTDAGQAAK